MTMLSYILHKLSRKNSTIVNCWFCNKDTVVPIGNKNCFDCPSCDQYNGFLSDGSYNKLIPAQQNEFLNHPVAAANQSQCPGMFSPKPDNNSLCEKCNSAQEAKVKKLASFTPAKWTCYETAVEEFRQQLEQMYPLCPRCEEVVQRVLLQQKSSLLGLKNKLFGNKVSAVASSPMRRPGCLRFLPAVLAAWLVLAGLFRDGDEEPFLPWPFERVLGVVPPAALRLFIYVEGVLSFAAVVVQATDVRSRRTVSLDSLGSLVLLLQLHLLCWLRTWHVDVMHYNIVQVVTCIGILSLQCLTPLQCARKKKFIFGFKSNHANNLQWHRLNSRSAASTKEIKTNRASSIPRAVAQRKNHYEPVPTVMPTEAESKKSITSSTCDDLRKALNNLQLGFSSKVTRGTQPTSVFRTREYGANIDRRIFHNASLKMSGPLNSQFAFYGRDRYCTSRAEGSQTSRGQWCSSGVRQVGGEWSRWRGAFEPLGLVEKPCPTLSRSPSRSSGYGSLTSWSSIPESSPGPSDHVACGLPAPRWSCVGRTPTAGSAGGLVVARDLYLGSPYVYYVFPHVLYPAPAWDAPPCPPRTRTVSPVVCGAPGRDTGCGYLQSCEIAAFVGALVFLVYTAVCCEPKLLLEGNVGSLPGGWVDNEPIMNTSTDN